ncbi:MAG: cobalt ECF transporter T component CbiQ [Anaerolineae bacterium]|nr:cobalt ECF transporter T component CbiQ [Anaerolineae bacterium]
MHQLGAQTKLLLALGYLFTTAAMPEKAWKVYPVLLILIICTAFLARIRLVSLIKRSLLAFPFHLAALPVLFTLPGDPCLILSWSKFSIAVSAPGVNRFLAIGAKMWLCIQAAALLTATTPMRQLLAAVDALRAPKVLTAAAALMWRYLFVISEEAVRLMRARSSRSALLSEGQGGGSIAWRAKVTGGMAGSLFLRSLERSERIYNAMQSRGYDGKIRTLPSTQAEECAPLTLVIGGFLFACLLLLGTLWQ